MEWKTIKCYKCGDVLFKYHEVKDSMSNKLKCYCPKHSTEALMEDIAIINESEKGEK